MLTVALVRNKPCKVRGPDVSLQKVSCEPSCLQLCYGASYASSRDSEMV